MADASDVNAPHLACVFVDDPWVPAEVLYCRLAFGTAFWFGVFVPKQTAKGFVLWLPFLFSAGCNLYLKAGKEYFNRGSIAVKGMNQ